MSALRKDFPPKPESSKLPSAPTGNASNPPEDSMPLSSQRNQTLNNKAEKYLRESGNIEDMPDAKDEQEAEGTF